MTWIFFLNQHPGSCSLFQLLNCFAMCTLQLIRAETSIQYSSQIRAIVHNDNQMIIFLFMLLLFILRPIYMYIYILLKIKWTFWALPDSIELHENQAENFSWNLVPRPISILCSPGLVARRHQAVTWTNVDFPLVNFCAIHLRVISQWVPKLLFN